MPERGERKLSGETWKIHHPGLDPELDAILARRLGRGHDKPCAALTAQGKDSK
jgi:hypothetical protein